MINTLLPDPIGNFNLQRVQISAIILGHLGDYLGGGGKLNNIFQLLGKINITMDCISNKSKRSFKNTCSL